MLLVVALAAPGVANAATVPVPDVAGPIPSTATSHAFGAAAHQLVPEDLAADGYVEEEYFVSGKANVYEWPQAGPAVVRTPDAPYTTRILVRRPINPADSSGNAVVEMLNPSNNFDINIGWAIMRKHFLRTGDTWVGITSRPVNVNALQTFDPQRYAALNWANPDVQCTINPPETGTERGLVWDINSQVAAWLKSNAATNPLRGHIDKTYGFGYSQTGGFLNTYVNAIHPLANDANGKPIYDGYFITVAGGSFVGLVPINACRQAPPLNDPRRVTANVGVPVMRTMSQSDYISGIAARRADSDEPQDRYRHYEMAGAAHASPFELYYSAKPEDIVKAGRSVPPFACNEGTRSRFPTGVLFDAMLQNLDAWVRTGTPPPPGRMIELTGNNQPVLDEHGNVVGGVRSPYVDVPTSTWFGNATGASFCFIAGYERPFSAEKLQLLYPSKADYVAKVTASVRSLVAQRYLTEADGRDIIQEANFACTPGPATDPRLPSCWTDVEGDVGGTVPATLSLTLGPNVSFGAFTPGVTKEYTATTTANVISTAGDATLSVSDPSATATGHLVNGAFSLAEPLLVAGSALPSTVKTYTGPVSNDPVTIEFRQLIKATDPLRTGTYSKTLTFTLSTTTP
ncbi:MAG TPA: alpha/beta hydrolase domain-containing protein [Solirubrobacteraceae bacterium]|nr:alpha/beta hydrolase domain-containing protein [Solirubrobacteraceae bacterium]